VSSPIVLEGVGKVFKSDWTFRPKRAVDNVSFEVKRGECFGFIGPNGAGKTTTIKLLLDIVRPSEGTIRLFGHPPSDRHARARVGFLPERPYFYDHLTGEETLALYARLSDAHEVEARVRDMLARVGLADAGKTRLGKYSKGMLQRIGLGAALIGEPELAVLDEPMSGLDPPGRRDVRKIIADLKARGTTVFFSSHILPDVEAICDRVAMIHKGKLVMIGEVKELRGHLEEAFIHEMGGTDA
jgi:ABC-2 type transport system ATP-binding protein